MVKANEWVVFLKDFAKKNNMTYGCALTDPRAKEEYRKRKERKPKTPPTPSPEPAPASSPAPSTTTEKWTRNDQKDLDLLIRQQLKGTLKNQDYLVELQQKRKRLGITGSGLQKVFLPPVRLPSYVIMSGGNLFGFL